MVRIRKRRRPRSKRFSLVAKPQGSFHPRVQKVGPEHFGIVSVDCAKARSKWMLANFYGAVCVPPTVVAHNRADLDATLTQLRGALKQHAIRDVLVAVERTGRYHQVVQRAFSAAGFETRVVHPFATKQFRQPADPGNKTDDTDLAAIHRAAVTGFALIEEPLPEGWLEIQLLARHRRDLVRKASALCCQIREHLNAAMPGYAACFSDLWGSPLGLRLVRKVGLAQDLQRAGLDGLLATLREDGVRCQERTLRRILAWAEASAAPDSAAATHRQILLALEDDRRQKQQEIKALEGQLAGKLARTEYAVLLSIPGINVVSAAEYAGEMGPITRYANPKTITGRAGLYPSRVQSDQVDYADGPLPRCANRQLRFALLQIAGNLITHNKYFAAINQRWKDAGKDPRHRQVCVGSRFARISYHMAAERNVFRHPYARNRSCIVEKLMEFHREHETPMEQRLADALAVIEQLPKHAYEAEAAPLAKELETTRPRRHCDPQPIGEILPLILAKLGIAPVQSDGSGDCGPTSRGATEPRTPMCHTGRTL